VAKGKPLFTLDTRSLRAHRAVSAAQVAQAEAQVAVTRESLIQAKRHFDSANSLDDPRALAHEERADRASEVAKLEASLASATANVDLAKAELASSETDLERATVTSPIDGTVLQVRLRAGEFIDGGAESRLIVGRTDPLHIRADVDEFEIPRLKPGTRATASPRGNADVRIPLEFVRFEPLVIPKRSLTGDSTERVDTRVLQAIYRIVPSEAPVFIGQQMDVFIEATPRPNHS
jgi:multidrug resistance efflux pump